MSLEIEIVPLAATELMRSGCESCLALM